MIGAIIGIIFVLIILGVVLWAVQQVLAVVPMAPPFGMLVRVLIIVVCVIIALWVIAQLLGMIGISVGFGRL